jgi:cbb3-type cytochrome c oxidase subunit III
LRGIRRVTVGGAGLVAAALLAAGCGAGGVASGAQQPDLQNGQSLFTQNCAACHTLQAANAHGTIGPNLDDAFAFDRKQGYPDSSIENVVLDQIRLGSGPIATYTTSKDFTRHCLPPRSAKCYATPMPADIVTGQDAIDVAAYVASVAGTGGPSVSPASLGTDGAAIFKAECAGCHTLAAAGATGTVGPNLDQLASKLTLAIVVRQVTNGGAVMPPFKGVLSAAQIQAVAKYVSSSAGKK